MNKLNKILILVFFFLLPYLFWQCGNSLGTEEDRLDGIQVEGLIQTPGVCLPDVKDKYVYPNSEVWGNLTSEEERLAVLQIPDEILKNISTFGLIRSILDIPTYWDYYASSNSSPIVRCYGIFGDYNCVQELEKREDNADALATYYSAVGLGCVESMDTEKRLLFSVQLTALETLFTKPDILKKYDYSEKQKVVAMMLQMYKKVTKLDVKMGSGALCSIAWIMYDDQYPPIVEYLGTNLALFDVNFVYANQIDDVVSFAESYTSKN